MHIAVQNKEENTFCCLYNCGAQASLVSYSTEQPQYNKQTILHGLTAMQGFPNRVNAIIKVLQRASCTANIENGANATPAMLACTNKTISDNDTLKIIQELQSHNPDALTKMFREKSSMQYIQYSKPNTYRFLKILQPYFNPPSYDETMRYNYNTGPIGS